MYRCNECGETFEEPIYMEVCWEDYYGVGSMFENKNYGVIAECPYCGEPIDREMDEIDETDE